MEAELSRQERQRVALAAETKEIVELRFAQEDEEESAEGGETAWFSSQTSVVSVEDGVGDEEQETANENDSEPFTEEVGVVEVGLDSIEELVTSFASLSPAVPAVEASETSSGDGNSDESMPSAPSSGDRAESASESTDSEAAASPSITDSSLQEEAESTLQDDTHRDDVAIDDRSMASSESRLSVRAATSIVENSHHSHEDQEEEEKEDDEGDEEDEDNDHTVEVVWCGSTPPWEEDPKANEINALLVHACQCDAVGRCRDLEFGALCPNMKRFLRVGCWASHNALWCRTKTARLLAQLLAYHSLHCPSPPSACAVPLCRQLRR